MWCSTAALIFTLSSLSELTRQSAAWHNYWLAAVWLSYMLRACRAVDAELCSWSQMHNLEASRVLGHPPPPPTPPWLFFIFVLVGVVTETGWRLLVYGCPFSSAAITVLKIYELSVHCTTFWPSVGLIGDSGRWNSNVVSHGGRSFILVLGCIMWHIYSLLSQSPSVGFRGD